jgi:hypothetical protein
LLFACLCVCVFVCACASLGRERGGLHGVV